MYIEKLREFLSYTSTLETDSGIKLNEDFEVIKAEQLSFKYIHSEYNILSNINISIKKGEKIAIVGSNGAGKSTLIKLLLKIYMPSDGIIRFNRFNYNECNTTSLRKRFSVIFQDFQHYSISIAENILMRKVESLNDEKIVWDVLEIVGLKSKIMELENGINTVLTKEFDDKGTILSGGELQKIAIARSLVTNADIIIMDEPTSSLDAKSESDIFKNVFKIYKDKTIIIISHRLSFTKLVDKIYYMEKGQIVESGNYEELMHKGRKYYNMNKLQNLHNDNIL